MTYNALPDIIPKDQWDLMLSSAELEELVVHLLRNPVVSAEARGLIRPEYFTEGEVPFAVILAAQLDILKDQDVDLLGSQFRVMLEAEIGQRLEADDSITDAEKVYLFGQFGPSDEDEDGEEESDEDAADAGENAEIDADGDIVVPDDDIDAKSNSPAGHAEGFLSWAFGLKPDVLNAQRGRKLLRRFLQERVIREVFAQAFGRRAVPKQPIAMLEECIRRLQQYESLGQPSTGSVSDEWEAYQKRQRQYLGRDLIGLKTGLPTLDERTLGLRGFILFGAMPGVGKTTLATQISVGVAQHHAVNNAVVVILSLDMHRDEIYDRIHCYLAGIDWATLKLGSKDRRSGGKPPWHNEWAQRQIQLANQRLVDEGIGRRIRVHDRYSLGDTITATRLAGIVKEFKAQVGATRSLLVLDYLQLLPVPDKVLRAGELEADRCRVRIVQDYLEKLRSPEDPAGDAALAISEARKPSSGNEGWGHGLSELMGSARLGYANDATLLYRTASKPDLKNYFNIADGRADSTLAQMESDGIAPVIITLEKGRAGTRRGSWPLLFDYRKSTFREVGGQHEAVIPRQDDCDDDAGEHAPSEPSAPALPPPGRRRGPTKGSSKRRNRTAATNGKPNEAHPEAHRRKAK
jgi:hypothetical protein